MVLRIGGEIDEKNLQDAQKASLEWDGLPIVVVDVDRCLESEREKVEALLEEYKAEKRPEIARQLYSQLYYKVRNNRQTASWLNIGREQEDKVAFCPEINLSALRELKFGEVGPTMDAQVSEEDMAENYDTVSATERKQEVSVMRGLLQQVQTIVQSEDIEK